MALILQHPEHLNLSVHDHTETSSDYNLTGSRIACSIEHLNQKPTPPRSTSTTALSPIFHIQNLPLEIQHLIYIFYLASLPPLLFSPQPALCRSDDRACPETQNQSPPTHHRHHLHDTQPLIPPSLFYHHRTFAFTSPSNLQELRGTHADFLGNVRRVRIPLLQRRSGHGGQHGVQPDWVFHVLSTFPCLTELTFWEDDSRCRSPSSHSALQIEAGKGEMGPERREDVRELENWWVCVVDALREGMGSTDALERGTRVGIWLRVECGSGGGTNGALVVREEFVGLR